ncbi:Zinc finger RING-type protein [Venturia nashicola]|nr:Zinc finger RING-type protein [Venturia nashicola]
MADNPAPPTASRARGGRGRGNGQQRAPRADSNNNQEGGSERGGRRRARGRGNGRGGNSNHTSAISAQSTTPNLPPPPSLPGEGIIGDRPTDDATKTQGEMRGKALAEGEEEDEDAEVCFICASPVIHQAVSPCNHRTCHICALRLRALYKSKACAHCRSTSEYVIFTDDPDKRYEDFRPADYSQTDQALGIRYGSQEIFEDTVLLLRYNCPDGECDVACLSWPDLHRHVKSAHQRLMCDLCTRNKKVFTHEHDLFAQNDLRKHEKFGDDNPGAVDQTGFKGHPECGFCRQRFYGDDELFVHCRDRHERCHICDRRNQGTGRQPQYYVDYNSLEQHFRKDHFQCPDRECLEKKFVVFDSEMDLKAHQIEAHPNGLTKDALRDARRVDMREFQVHERYQPQRGERGGRRGGRGGEERGGQDRGRGRGRDPNAEPLPQSSAQPMRRDELAYQRQMAIQSAQSVTTRTFGGQLSAQPTPAYAARGPAQAPATVTATRPAGSFPSLDSLSSAISGPSPRPSSPAQQEALTPQELARRQRHNAVIERASGMLRNDQAKIAEFRAKVSAFRNSTVTAPALVDSFFTLFDRPSSEVGSLVKELADIFEIPAKRDALLKAWNDWRAINEDYPSLPGSTTASSSGMSTLGGKRVLKLKTSTAQSARSSVSKTGSWGSTGNTSLFPALPPGAAASRAGSSRSGGSGTPWAGATAGGNSNTSSQAPSRTATPRPVAAAAGSSGTRRPGTDAFPALPAAAKPTSTKFTPGYNGYGVRREQAAPATANPWGGASSTGTNGNAESGSNAEPGPDHKKKGNKNKKQTLFHFG